MATSYSKPTVRASLIQTAGMQIFRIQVILMHRPINLSDKASGQYFNWILNYVSSPNRYLCQTGIPAYDPIETYLQGAIVYSGGAMWN